MKKTLLFAFFYASLILSPALLSAQQWLWARQATSSIKEESWAPSVATDNNGNVWHIGTFFTNLSFGSTMLTSLKEDAFLVKYDNSGNLLWAKQSVSGTGSEAWGQFVATDDSGNAYITGHFDSTSVKFGSFTLSGLGSNTTVFVVKYDKNGNVIWARQSTPSATVSAYGQSVACDGKGYEYVTGYFWGGSLSFGTSTVTSVNPAEFLVKYDYNGNVIWATQSTGTADSTYANSVAVSRTGDEYVTGYFNGAPTFGATTLDAPKYDIFLTKYDPNGNVLWAEQSKGNNPSTSSSSYDEGVSVAADIYDNVYLTGFFANSLKFGTTTLTGPTTPNIFYAKFAPNGNLNWLKQSTPIISSKWFGFSVSTDSYNHFYFSGYSPSGISEKVVFAPDTLSTGSTLYGGASVLVKFDSSGRALCGNIFPNYLEFTNSLNGEASDSSGNYIYMGGEFSDEILVLNDSLQPGNDGDLPYTARWLGCSDASFTAQIIGVGSAPCNYTCNGSATATPIGGNPPYSYIWNTGQTTSSITGLCPGTYSVIVTDSARNTAIQTVIISSPVTNLKIAHTYDSICPGGSVNFTASGITTYTWFPTAGLSCTTCPNPTATPTATTTYYVAGQDTNSSGCLDTASITVLVTPIPTITITQETSSCSGEILLTATGATIYDWTPTASLSCPTCAETYATPTVTTTYTLIGSNNGCPDTTTVTVSPIPVIALSLSVTAPHDTICEGDTVQITATGSGISTWAWSPVTGLSCSTCPDPKASPTVTTTYVLYGYDSLGCDTTVEITITVAHHAPTITVEPDTICTGDSARLIAGGGITYLWSTSQTTDSIWVNPATTTNYTLTSTSKGCVASTSATVHVTPPPTVNVSLSDTICQGKSITISASGANTYSWLPTTGLNCYNCPSPIASPTATITYTVTGISTAGCIGSNTVTIVVTPPPIATIAASKDTVCSGDTIQLIGGGGGTYSWSTGKTTDSIYVNPTSSTIYLLTVSKNGCTDTISKTIQVFSSGSASVSLSKDSICSGDSTTLTASGATSFLWSNGATTSSIEIAPGSTATYTVYTHSKCATDTIIKTVRVIPFPVPVILGKTGVCAGKQDTLTASGGIIYIWSTGSTAKTIYPVISGTTTITLTAYNGVCSKDTMIVLTVLPSPTVTVNTPDPICSGDSVTLTATGGGNYYWSTGSTGSSIIVNPTVTTTYSVLVTGSNGCSADANTEVTIEVPTIYACCDSTIITGGTAVLYADSSYTYKWYPSTGISCDTCPEITVSPTVTTTYTVTGTDKEGCEVARVITVIVEPPCADYFVPNVFTPGASGINNEFVIKAENLTAYSIIIYDRWGKEMYKSTNPLVYWNGNTEGGDPASAGVYYYIIKSTCRDNTYNKDGFVQLIR